MGGTMSGLPFVPPLVRRLLLRLPVYPPSLLVAQALNHMWWPLVDGQTRQALRGRVVEVLVDDVGVTCRLIADESGLRPASPNQPAALRLRANAPVYWRLLQGLDDPDTLFFDRLMVMEGDTEFGLLLKNTLDAVGPPQWSLKRATRPSHAN